MHTDICNHSIINLINNKLYGNRCVFVDADQDNVIPFKIPIWPIVGK